MSNVKSISWFCHFLKTIILDLYCNCWDLKKYEKYDNHICHVSWVVGYG